MNIYQSEFLIIAKEGDTLIQSWTDKHLDVNDFKLELIRFMTFFHKLKPKEVLVDVKKCRLVIPKTLDSWMAETVLILISKKGIKNLAFTIAEDSAVHLAIATSLDKAKPIIQSTYFSDLERARSHFKKKEQTRQPKFEYQTDSNTDSIEIDLNIHANDLPRFLTSMKQIEIDNEFAKDHFEQYNSLTYREVEILKLIASGKTNKQIGKDLFIEESSVKSHRKNIKVKLNITSSFDIYQFARCFKLI
jgi:DNA-binding CsgD family transcriptional regulator